MWIYLRTNCLLVKCSSLIRLAKLYESDKVYYASELLKMVKIRNTYREGKYEPRCENDRRIGTNM